eukprot:3938673-Pleurochrysis_carterae.AAC.1
MALLPFSKRSALTATLWITIGPTAAATRTIFFAILCMKAYFNDAPRENTQLWLRRPLALLSLSHGTSDPLRRRTAGPLSSAHASIPWVSPVYRSLTVESSTTLTSSCD